VRKLKSSESQTDQVHLGVTALQLEQRRSPAHSWVAFRGNRAQRIGTENWKIEITKFAKGGKGQTLSRRKLAAFTDMAQNWDVAGIAPEWAITRLQTLPEPVLKLTVFHLLGGGSVTALANYLYAATPKDSPLSDCSEKTLRRYLTAMNLRLTEWLRRPELETAPPWLRNVLEAANSDSDGNIPAGATEVDELARLAALAEHVDALTLLKETFLLGVQRQESFGAMESRFGVLLPIATENIRLMVKIACEIGKIELIKAFPKLKQNEGRRIIRAATVLRAATLKSPRQALGAL
jgi:hypothetical protein